MQNAINWLASPPNRIFLIDGVGAALSAFCLGVLQPALPGFFGVPLGISQPLALVAALFAVYSLGCFTLAPQRWKLFLGIIASSNALYGAYTLWLVFGSSQQIATIGKVYFVVEVLVLAVLVFIETRLIIRSRVGRQRT